MNIYFCLHPLFLNVQFARFCSLLFCRIHLLCCVTGAIWHIILLHFCLFEFFYIAAFSKGPTIFYICALAGVHCVYIYSGHHFWLFWPFFNSILYLSDSFVLFFASFRPLLSFVFCLFISEGFVLPAHFCPCIVGYFFSLFAQMTAAEKRFSLFAHHLVHCWENGEKSTIEKQKKPHNKINPKNCNNEKILKLNDFFEQFQCIEIF